MLNCKKAYFGAEVSLTVKKKTEKNANAAEDKKLRGQETGEDRLNWRYQDKQYNESFKKWRKQKQDSVGFYFVEKPDRLTYQDGVGFINDYPEAHEAKTFRRVLNILGLVLLYRVIVDILFIYFFPLIMEKMGMNIYYSFFSGGRYGSRTLITFLDIFQQILGRLVPTALLIRHLEIPASVMLPTKVTNKPMFEFSFFAALFTAGVCAVMTFFYNGILGVFRIDAMPSYTVSADSDGIAYTIIVCVLAVPIISEFCTHGVILQLVRQFGDGTAIFVTSLIIAASSYDIVSFPFVAATSFVTGYFVIRTGSVITGVIMRVITRAYVCVLCYISFYADPAYSAVLMRAFVFVTIMIGLIASVWFLYNKSDSFSMRIKPGYMSFGRKILEAATCIPVVIWFAMTFLVTALNIKFTH